MRAGMVQASMLTFRCMIQASANGARVQGCSDAAKCIIVVRPVCANLEVLSFWPQAIPTA